MADSNTAFTTDLIGVGSPIMDLVARVSEETLARVPGEKGGMVLVDPPEMASLLTLLAEAPARTTGGSAANCILNAARLGLRTTLLGKLGRDEMGVAYRERFGAAGVGLARFKEGDLPNATCLALVTPDAQRTLRTCLGAAATMSPEDISPEDFAGCRHAHIEGYLVFNQALADAVLATARAAGCTVSVDLASFDVIQATRPWILGQLRQGIDIVFANEDEIRALFEDNDSAYDVLARRLAGFGGIAAVKVGKDGAWIAQGDALHRIEPVPVAEVIDTNGAGDSWAAGFLTAHLRGADLATAGALGSALGAACVQALGPALGEEHWPRLRAMVPGV